MPGSRERAAQAAAAEYQSYVQNIADRRSQVDEYLTAPARDALAQAQQLGAQASQRTGYAQRAAANAAQARNDAQQLTSQLDQLRQQILQADSEARQASAWASQAQAQAHQFAQDRRMDLASDVWTQAQQAAARAQQLNEWLATARPHAQQLQTDVQQLQARDQQLTNAAAQATADAQQLATQAQAAHAHSQTLLNQARQTQENLATSRPDLWRFVNEDTARPMQDGEPASDTSAFTGDGNPPPSDRSRRYDRPGGYRRPRLAEQRALEGAMPRNPDGSFQRTPDPRGPWLRLMNGIGRQFDPTRNVNCNDATLSLFETFFHGRPRVAAPRTFDGYGQGRVNAALNGETGGPGRVEDVTGGRYQSLTGNAGNLSAAQRQHVVEQGFDAVQNQLLQAGHGSFAFLITAWTVGGAHAWAAVNHHGTIIYVDAQSGAVSDTGPMHSPSRITMMDALVIGANGVPVPFAGAPQGTWNARPPTPLYLAPPAPVTPPAPITPPTPVTSPAPVSPVTAQPAAHPDGIPRPDGLTDALAQRYDGLSDPRAQQQFHEMYRRAGGDPARLERALNGQEQGAATRGLTLEQALADRFQAAQDAAAAVVPPSPELIAAIDTQLAEISSAQARIDAFAQANPHVTGVNTWRTALTTEQARLEAGRRDSREASAEQVARRANSIGGLVAEIALAEQSVGVTAVALDISAVRPDGTPLSSDADVVAEDGQVWKDSKNYGLFGTGSENMRQLVRQAVRQLEILAYNPSYRDGNGHPPRLEWNFPRGVTPEVAAALESLRVVDPVTGEVVLDPRTGQPLQLTVTSVAPGGDTQTRLDAPAPGSPPAPGSVPPPSPSGAPTSGRDQSTGDPSGDRADQAAVPSGVPKWHRFVLKGLFSSGVAGMAVAAVGWSIAAGAGNVVGQTAALIGAAAAVTGAVVSAVGEWGFDRVKERIANRSSETATPAAPALSATQETLVDQVDSFLDGQDQAVASRDAELDARARRLAEALRTAEAEQGPLRRAFTSVFAPAETSALATPDGAATTGNQTAPVSGRASQDVSDRADQAAAATAEPTSSADKLPGRWAFIAKTGIGPAAVAAVVGIGVWVSGAAITLLAAPAVAMAAVTVAGSWADRHLQRYKAGLSDARTAATTAQSQSRFDAAMQPLLDREQAQREREQAQWARERALAEATLDLIEEGPALRPDQLRSRFAGVFSSDQTNGAEPQTSRRPDATADRSALPSAVPGVHRVIAKSLLSGGLPGATAAATAGWIALAAGNVAGPAVAAVAGTVAVVGSVLSGVGDWTFDRLSERLENRQHAQANADGDLTAEQRTVVAEKQALLDRNERRLDARDALLDQRVARLAAAADLRSEEQNRGPVRRLFSALFGAGTTPAPEMATRPEGGRPDAVGPESARPDAVQPESARPDGGTADRADQAAAGVDYAKKLPRGWAFFFKAGLGALGGIGAGVIAAQIADASLLALAAPSAAAVATTLAGAMAERWFQRRKLEVSEARKALESQRSDAESRAVLDEHARLLRDREAQLRQREEALNERDQALDSAAFTALAEQPGVLRRTFSALFGRTTTPPSGQPTTPAAPLTPPGPEYGPTPPAPGGPPLSTPPAPGSAPPPAPGGPPAAGTAPVAGDVRALVDSALAEDGLLPGSAVVENGTVRVGRGDGATPFTIRFATAPTLDGVLYQAVATVHVTDADSGLVRIAETASPDQVRRAVAASVAELTQRATEHAADRRTDATTMLAEGSRETTLSPRDVGRIAELRLLSSDLSRAAASNDVARVARLNGEAAVLVMAMGLVEQDGAPVHGLPGNTPVVGVDASQLRLAAINQQLGGLAAVQSALDAAYSAEGQAQIAAAEAQRAARRDALHTWARDAIAARDQADQALAARVDAGLAANPGHVFERLIIGGGWAATADFVTMGAQADAGNGIPPVMAISLGNDPWSGRGDLLMGQVPNELEVDGFPFQPGDFAANPAAFAQSGDFAAAVGAARAMSRMPTYQGDATAVVARPASATGWPDGARYQVSVDGRTFFAASIDVVSGPGPARVPQAPNAAGQRFVDPASGVTADHATSPPTFRDRAGTVIDPQTLPDSIARILGLGGTPYLADQQGRLTNPWVLDPASGYSVDPSTGHVRDGNGSPVDPASLDPIARQTLGFAPDGSFGDPRYVRHESGYAVHPVSGDVVVMTTGTRVDPASLDPATRSAIQDAMRRCRVQFGGQNTASQYRPDDRVLVFGAGASGAWDVEQAQSRTPHVDWVARSEIRASYEGNEHLSALRAEFDATTDPARRAELGRRLSFEGGYNRRNTVPGRGAYAGDVATPARQSVRVPVSVQLTVDGKFAVVFDGDPAVHVYNRVVFSIGQDATQSGGVGQLLRDVALQPLRGAGGEVNGIRDGSGLRVLGAASVDRSTLGLLSDRDARVTAAALRAQAGSLPADSRNIAPSIRHHGQRIAEANRPWDQQPTPESELEREVSSQRRSIHFQRDARSGADLPRQIRDLVDRARDRLLREANPSVRLDARLAALATIGAYAGVLDALATTATGTGDLRPLIDGVTQLSRMVQQYGDQHALTGDPAWPDLHGVDPLDTVEMNTRAARIDPATHRFHVLDQAIMAAQITRVMGPEFGAYVADRFSRLVPLDADAVRTAVTPDQLRRFDAALSDPRTLGLYDPALDLAFARPGRSLTEVASSVVHESTHTLQPDWRGELAELETRASSPAELRELIAQRKFEREFEAFTAQREFLRRLVHHRTEAQLQRQGRGLAVPDQYAWLVYQPDTAIRDHIFDQYLTRDMHGRISARDQFGGHELERGDEDVIDTLARYIRDLRRMINFGYLEPDEPEERHEPRGPNTLAWDGERRGH